MMYAEPIAFEEEFITRTKAIINEYSGKYETTLFINAMLGLLVIPKEKRFDEITDDMIETEILKKTRKCCKDNTSAVPLSLQHISKRMRNAVAHGNFQFEAEKDPNGNVGSEIIRISFYDDRFHSKKQNYKAFDFSAKFDVTTLREFVFAFSNAILLQIGDQP